MARTVFPSDYIPSQVVTEFIRDQKFTGGKLDGICYSSAQDVRLMQYAFCLRHNAILWTQMAVPSVTEAGLSQLHGYGWSMQRLSRSNRYSGQETEAAISCPLVLGLMHPTRDASVGEPPSASPSREVGYPSGSAK